MTWLAGVLGEVSAPSRQSATVIWTCTRHLLADQLYEVADAMNAACAKGAWPVAPPVM